MPVAIAGSLKQYHQGNVNLACFLWIALAGMAFSVLGAWLSTKIPSFWLQRIFALFIIAVGVKMLMK